MTPPKLQNAKPTFAGPAACDRDLDVLNCGLSDFAEVWALQKKLLACRVKDEIEDTLVLTEHRPVYTQGVSSKAPEPRFLPHPLHAIERGGDVTYHGPGQLVGYPILRLSDHGLTPTSYLRRLEEILVEAVGCFGVKAYALKGFTGVWADNRKIASIGVAVKNGVTYHGFALNVNCDLTPFHLIYPCNLEPEQMGSLESLFGCPVDFAQVQAEVSRVLLAQI